MADLRHYSDSNDDTGSTPRWVKVFGIIALVLVLLVVVLLVTGLGGPGGHGPGRHSSSGDPGGPTTPSSVIQHGLQQP